MELSMIKDKVFELTDCNFQGEIETDYFDGVRVKYDGKNATIGYSTKPQFARGCTLLAKAVSSGKINVDITETPKFSSLGVMLDMSRNGVMRADRVKEFLLSMAALGFNMLMLYTEDTYILDDLPEFGFMRGGYTKEELLEIDDYAYSLGIEVIPCIQTLAHLDNFLKWPSAQDIKDIDDILLPGYGPTYDFIEKCIASVKSCFRSKRIHIGMDEAFHLGRGQYIDKFGYKDGKKIVTEHLGKVVEICEKYGLKPMMWSDMYFKKRGSPYDPDAYIPPEVEKYMPDAEMVYWDYYRADYSAYDKVLARHETLGRKVAFAGAVWTWSGFVPNTLCTDTFTPPALRAAADHKVDTVFATMWGDGGCETNYFTALGQLAYFSEYCYKDGEISADDVYETGAFVSGFDRDYYNACLDFHIGCDVAGKRFIWADILYGMHGTNLDVNEYAANMKKAAELMKTLAERQDKNQLHYKYAEKVFAIAGRKAEIFYSVYEKYKQGDLAYFKNLSEKALPKLKNDYEELSRLHKKQWLETFKPFGFEVLLGRYAASAARISYTADLFADFASGKITRIEEFDANPDYGHAYGYRFLETFSGCTKDVY